MKADDRCPPRRILVVDDDRDSAACLAMLLRVTGHEAHTAFDGLEAVEKSASIRPDVVLMDILLPRLDGYDACRRIRRQPKMDRAVILALSGLVREDSAEKCREAGFDGQLVKPVAYDTLMTKLAALSGTGNGR